MTTTQTLTRPASWQERAQLFGPQLAESTARGLAYQMKRPGQAIRWCSFMAGRSACACGMTSSYLCPSLSGDPL